MNIIKIYPDEKTNVIHHKIGDFTPVLELHSMDSEKILLLWPQSVDASDLSRNTENDLDSAFIKSKVWRTGVGWLSTAMTLCSNFELVLNNSSVSKNSYTDLSGKLLVGDIDVKQYFEILRQKLEHFQLEDIIDNLPESETVGFRTKYKINLNTFSGGF